MKQNKKSKMVVFCAVGIFSLIGGGASKALAKQRCLDAKDLEAKYKGVTTWSRCGRPLNAKTCKSVNELALEQGVICKSAINWLNSEKLCAISYSRLLVGVCPQGCFEANTLFEVQDESGNLQTVPAHEVSPNDQMMSLAPGASLEDGETLFGAINKVVSGGEESNLFVFSLENGTELSVTKEHPMVLSDGRIVRAKSVELGDSFVTSEGASVSVTNIDRRASHEEVYNFDMAGDSTENHVIVANGVFVGDLALQSTLDSELEAINHR